MYRTVRAAFHLHSVYSHDACDGNGLPDGSPNLPCLASLRAALCSSTLEAVSLTDHPSFMEDYLFEELVLYDGALGDRLVLENGEPIANELACADGRRVLLMVGYESTHTMPLGLRHHVAEEFYAAITNDRPLEQSQALVQALKDAGAVVSMAHSEEDDISAERIVASGLDSMEWYNPHGNIKHDLGGDSLTGGLEAVSGLLDIFEPYVQGSSSAAHPDLFYLVLLQQWPAEGFDKWRTVNQSRPVTGIFGNDVHENVSVEPLCARDNVLEQLACVAAAEAVLSPALAGLATGGTILLKDGQRMDAYARFLRLLQNRILVPTLTMDELTSALRKGRSYGVYTVFGEPTGFAFTATDAAGATWTMGDQRQGALTLHVKVPAVPTTLPGGPTYTATEAAQMIVRLVVRRVDATGTTTVHESTGLGRTIDLPVSATGAYFVELWTKPEHLRTALDTEGANADHEYLWVITNPIRLVP